ncbi:hypothetical protein BAE44_0023945 [Dichanthelium oligosanthes]|uniref:Transmembrane protein 45B n=1 Tax=Dichanthelium oligosanthes TaxID=888268 RepID=A0A1E5UQ91_9POAL|nr:hypothetical protein BAE44_0023945 [Dichanthelium oligosanthes]
MGTLVGHLAPGIVLLVSGLWQLFGHIRLFLLRPSSYAAPVWFPVRGVRHLDLIWLIIAAVIEILWELVIVPAKHQSFDDDGIIPSVYLYHFEHTTISLAMLIFAAVTISMDMVVRRPPPMSDAVSRLVAASWFAQELLLFHFHSADHMSVEGHFHRLLQTIVAVTLATTLLLIPYPRSIVVSIVRSASLVFQGLWFVVTGVMLWTPAFVPKGCFLTNEEGRDVIRCRTGEAVHRAKSLVNLQFSWYLSGIVLFIIVFYFQMAKWYPEEQRYVPVVKDEDSGGDSDGQFKIGDDLEAGNGEFGHLIGVTKTIEMTKSNGDW